MKTNNESPNMAELNARAEADRRTIARLREQLDYEQRAKLHVIAEARDWKRTALAIDAAVDAAEQLRAAVRAVTGLREAPASPTPAEPGRPEPGPWTSHGHVIPGVTVGPAASDAARCGGIRLCGACKRDAMQHPGFMVGGVQDIADPRKR